MKPQTYAIVAALLLAAIFLLMPRTRSNPESPTPGRSAQGSANEIGDAVVSSRGFSRDEVGDGPRLEGRAREVAEMGVAPEPLPEQSLEWRITRQQAMLEALRRHLEAAEARWRTATSELDRQTLLDQIEVLRTELTHQEGELSRLQELPSVE
jgi:hypothetical protein